MQRLFKQTNWAKNRTIEGIEFLLENTKNYVLVRDDTLLIGYGRALSDGIYRAMLDDIVVDHHYRKKGIGHQIVQELLKQVSDIEQVFLNTKPELKHFYNTHGFHKCKAFTMSLD
ncbi:GNAT family N-acetyltransferase [Aquimarina gracilis]|uniref:GNAT family N-acetyltransferase n=1 Tax=Aquimarina gracilis TaxID=874422 RepID=A0ABU6A1X7_9FLAO|nr:GNAT family N-acetyltransferase [Aquimarina gracilis]MEB3348131.1 GNAT family N-acetyltransferase [Aquimarina gracilis]